MNRNQINEPGTSTTQTIPCADWQVDPPARVVIREESGKRKLGLMTIMIVPHHRGISPGKKQSRFNVNKLNELTLRKESLC